MDHVDFEVSDMLSLLKLLRNRRFHSSISFTSFTLRKQFVWFGMEFLISDLVRRPVFTRRVNAVAIEELSETTAVSSRNETSIAATVHN